MADTGTTILHTSGSISSWLQNKLSEEGKPIPNNVPIKIGGQVLVGRDGNNSNPERVELTSAEEITLFYGARLTGPVGQNSENTTGVALQWINARQTFTFDTDGAVVGTEYLAPIPVGTLARLAEHDGNWKSATAVCITQTWKTTTVEAYNDAGESVAKRECMTTSLMLVQVTLFATAQERITMSLPVQALS